MATGRKARPGSWVAAGVILGGFAVGGVALITYQWWLFWTALGVVVVGAIVALVVDIFSDVVLDPIHGEDAQPHISPVRGRKKEEAPEELEPKLLLFGQAPSTSRESGDQEDAEASS